MKSLFLFILLFSLTTYAEIECQEDGQGGHDCYVPIENSDVSSCDVNSSNQVKQNNLDGNTDFLPFCQNDQIVAGEKLSEDQKKKKIKEAKKLCNKQARKFRRQNAKKYFKKFKLGRALKIALTRKKKIINKGKTGENSTETLNIDSKFNVNDLQGLSKEEASKAIMDQLREEIPNLDQLVNIQKELGKPYKTEEYPINLFMKTDAGNSCMVSMDDFPEPEYQVKPCEDCDERKVQNNFQNDCAYMVTKDFPESEARAMMGLGPKKSFDPYKERGPNNQPDSHCNTKNLTNNDDVSRLKDAATKLCDAAENGQKPTLTIESSRNLFNDYTPQLAKRRGEFSQKYIFREMKKLCGDAEDAPNWVNDEKAFKEEGIVNIHFPKYDRDNNTDGNYGPNPYASTESERNKEYEFLRSTLEREEKEILDVLKDRLKTVEKEIVKFDKQINEHKNEFNIIKDAKVESLDDLPVKQIEINDMIDLAENAYNKKFKLEQEKSDLKAKIKAQEKNRYQKVNGEYVLVKKLKEYYEHPDNNPAGKNQKHNENFKDPLFNRFKMARVKVEVERKNDYGIDVNLLTPEVQLALNTMLEMDSFTCELKSFSKKNNKIGLKKGLKVTTVIAAPVAIPTIAGLGLLRGISYYGLKVLCLGCDLPGKIFPKFQKQLEHRKRTRGHRKFSWNAVKDSWERYVDWDGNLDTRRDPKTYYYRPKGSKVNQGIVDFRNACSTQDREIAKDDTPINNADESNNTGVKQEN
jgi:hypothetical protein